MPLNALRLALTFLAATLSFYLIELPIRERRRPTLLWWRGAAVERQPHAPRRDLMRGLALPAVGLTFLIVLASSTGATAAPSYLSGSQTPTFSNPGGPVPGSPGRPGATATSPVTFAVPKINFIWAFGDPLFCGAPRPDETNGAVSEARKLGAPPLAKTATGLRVLVLGDSTACSLFPGMKAVGDQVGASVAQAAVFGCGMASGQITTTRGEQITPHSERCPAMVEAAQVPAVSEMRPDVVVWMSLWEKSDIIANGQTLVSGSAPWKAEMLRRMNAELARVTAFGAKVMLVTIAAPAPNDARGDQHRKQRGRRRGVRAPRHDRPSLRAATSRRDHARRPRAPALPERAAVSGDDRRHSDAPRRPPLHADRGRGSGAVAHAPDRRYGPRRAVARTSGRSTETRRPRR